MKEIFYGFKPSVVKQNKSLYLALLVVLLYGIACQVFMPYMIIYMKTYLGFTVVEYSVVFGLAIILGAVVNLYLTKLSDKKDKVLMLYPAAGIMAAGLIGMYLSNTKNHIADLILFGVAGFVMITGYILVSALCGAIVRDNTPKDAVGKFQGVRMVFSVLIPMLVGPMLGNAVNAWRNIPLDDLTSADVMTTQYIPAPEIFLVGGLVALLMFIVIPLLKKQSNSQTIQQKTQGEQA
jgi:MFS family permease